MESVRPTTYTRDKPVSSTTNPVTHSVRHIPLFPSAHTETMEGLVSGVWIDAGSGPDVGVVDVASSRGSSPRSVCTYLSEFVSF